MESVAVAAPDFIRKILSNRDNSLNNKAYERAVKHEMTRLENLRERMLHKLSTNSHSRDMLIQLCDGYTAIVEKFFIKHTDDATLNSKVVTPLKSSFLKSSFTISPDNPHKEKLAREQTLKIEASINSHKKNRNIPSGRTQKKRLDVVLE